VLLVLMMLAELHLKINFSLEECMEYIQGDELVEITPLSLRLRKIHLDENERKRYKNSLAGA
jgi:GTP-binding protein